MNMHTDGNGFCEAQEFERLQYDLAPAIMTRVSAKLTSTQRFTYSTYQSSLYFPT
jgi:hypothetical protein